MYYEVKGCYPGSFCSPGTHYMLFILVSLHKRSRSMWNTLFLWGGGGLITGKQMGTLKNRHLYWRRQSKMSLLCGWDRMMGELCCVCGKFILLFAIRSLWVVSWKDYLASIARSAVLVNNSYYLGAVVVLEIMFSEDKTEILNLI